jgi:hypothetical protein
LAFVALSFVMNDFEVTINSVESNLVFKFTPIHTVQGIVFFASVSGEQQQFFYMKKHGEVWQIIKAPKPPDWILLHEKDLARAIEQHLSPT